MVRIAIPTEKGGLEDNIYPRFGRAPTFTIIDIEKKQIKNLRIIENPGHKASGGAGVKAVQLLANEGVEIVMGPTPGPNAYFALKNAGIKHYPVQGLNVREAVEAFLREDD